MSQYQCPNWSPCTVTHTLITYYKKKCEVTVDKNEPFWPFLHMFGFPRIFSAKKPDIQWDLWVVLNRLRRDPQKVLFLHVFSNTLNPFSAKTQVFGNPNEIWWCSKSHLRCCHGYIGKSRLNPINSRQHVHVPLLFSRDVYSRDITKNLQKFIQNFESKNPFRKHHIEIRK